MDIVHLIILSLIQGITEFLPISSSAHLILLPHLFHWQDQGLSFDVVLHLGTLMAVIIYFWQELSLLIKSLFNIKGDYFSHYENRLCFGILLATIPVVLAGFLFNEYIETTLRSPKIIAFGTIFFGAILILAEYVGTQRRALKQLKWYDILVIGLLQALALIPGTSRSGITMTGGLFTGLTKEATARFSFLLSIPVIILATLHELLKFHTFILPWQDYLLGFLISFLSAYAVIYLFLKTIARIGFLPFFVYRLILGIIILLFC